MLSKRIPLAALCLAALVACDAGESVTGPTGPDLSGIVPPVEEVVEFLPGVPVLDPFGAHHDQRGVEWARGSGFFTFGTGRRYFAFTASTDAEGNTSGQYQIDNQTLGTREAGTVTCLSVDGNQAWIGGVITASSVPGREGVARIFRVVDGPDQVSFLIDAEPLMTCETRPPLPVQDIEGGSVEVQDAA
jgi:hypothetical protein